MVNLGLSALAPKMKKDNTTMKHGITSLPPVGNIELLRCSNSKCSVAGSYRNVAGIRQRPQVTGG